MFKDLRHAVRLLWQSRGWTAVVVLSLALGIGANTAIFSAVNARLLTSLPVQHPEELVRFRYAGRNDMVTSSSGYGFLNKTPDGRDVRATFSYPMYAQFVADNRSMTDLLACAPFGRVNVFVDGQSEIASAFISSGNYYQMLGVPARIGRTILPEDDRPTAAPVAVISSKYWHSRFGTDPAVVGKVIKVNNVTVTIVGVIAPHFSGIQQPVSNPPDISLPLALDTQLSTNTGPGPARLSQATYWWLQVMGRLKPGMSAAQAQGNLEGVFQQTARSGLEDYLKSLSDEERSRSYNKSRTEVPRLLVEPAGRGMYDISTNEFRSVALLAVVVALVLLIVCANVANLLLSRATTRQKELSVRLSLGATRGRLVRQLLTESLLLAALGGGVGVVVGYWGKQLLPGAADVPRPFDWRVLTFVLAVSGLTGLVFGILPALRGTGMNVNSALKETSRGVVGSRSWASKILLAVQVAISLVLLVGAGLFLRTLTNLRQVDVGFNPQNLLLFRVNPQLNRYDEKRTLALYREMLDRLSAVPGVTGVALSAPALLSGSVNSTSIFVHGRAYAPDVRDRDNNINRLVVSANFFEVMGIPVLSGRGFADRDSDTAPKVVMINQAAAKKYFANENPVGQRFGSNLETAGQLEVIGIVRDVKYNSVRDEAPPTMFVPYTQTRVGNAAFEVRTRSAPAAVTGAVREAVRQIDQNLPVMDVSTQLEQVEMRFQQEKFFAQAYTLFGIVALLLAALGLFGLMSYNVARRTNEIGIRMALGAQRRDVLRLVMRESMILVSVGVAVGLALALFASRFVAALLYGVPPTDVLALALPILVMLVVSAVAGYIPARRASRVDPMVALHYD
jgi:predicted permease